MKTKRQVRAMLATVFRDPMVVWCRTLGTQIKRRDSAVCTCSQYRTYNWGPRVLMPGEKPDHHIVLPLCWWNERVERFGLPK